MFLVFLLFIPILIMTLLVDSIQLKMSLFLILCTAPLIAFQVKARSHFKEKYSHFSPINIIVLTSFLHFILPGLYNWQYEIIPTENDWDYIYANILLGVFLIAFFVAYVCTRNVGKRVSGLQNKFLNIYTSYFSLIYAFILMMASIGAVGYFVVQAGGLTSMLQSLGLRMLFFEGKGVMLSLITVSVPAFIIFLIAHLRYRSPISLFALAAVAIIAIATNLMTGSRGSVISFALMGAVLYDSAVNKISAKNIFLIFLCLLSFLFFYIVAFRTTSSSDELTGVLSVWNYFELVWNELFGKGTFKEVNSVARVVEVFPQHHGYLFGRSFLATITFPLPSQLDPFQLAGGNELYTRYVRPEIWEAGRGDRVTIVGESFMNFGLFGVLFVGFLLGRVTKKIYSNLRANPLLINCVFYSIFVFFLMSLIRGDLATATFQFFRFLIPLSVPYICYIILARKVKIRS